MLGRKHGGPGIAAFGPSVFYREHVQHLHLVSGPQTAMGGGRSRWNRARPRPQREPLPRRPCQPGLVTAGVRRPPHEDPYPACRRRGHGRDAPLRTRCLSACRGGRFHGVHGQRRRFGPGATTPERSSPFRSGRSRGTCPSVTSTPAGGSPPPSGSPCLSHLVADTPTEGGMPLVDAVHKARLHPWANENRPLLGADVLHAPLRRPRGDRLLGGLPPDCAGALCTRHRRQLPVCTKKGLLRREARTPWPLE